MYEELLKALRCCAVNDCGECGYNRRDIPSGDYCTDKLIPLAADAIEELSTHYCKHMIRNEHDRGDDGLCKVLKTEPPKEET